MTNLLKYDSTYGTLLNAFQSTDLNGLAAGSYAFGSGAAAVLDNTTTLDLYVEVRVSLGSINPTGNPTINLWVLLSMDGTAFEDPQAAGAPPAGLAGYSRGVTTGSSAKLAIFRGIVLNPGKSKLLFQNNTGQPLAGSANAIDYWKYTQNLNG